MEKIALDVLHEVELYSNTELDEFDAQLFLINKDKIQLAFDLTRVKKNESIFTFKIPKSLESFLRDPVKYKVYVYLDNARFLADDGEMKIVSQEDFSGAKLLNPEEDKKKDVKFTAKIKKDETPKEEPKPKDTKKDSKKDKEEPQGKKPEVKESKEIDINEVLSQHSKINEHITNKKNSKSLRDYAERIERNKKLSENKNELNEKLKKILSDFTSKS